MKLCRLQVAGFGVLRRCEFAFGPGLNLVCGPNEAGKSTLQAALGAALYGLYDGCRPPREADALLLRYQPWAGGPYAMTLELELAGGRRLVISRDFAERRATRTTVFDAASGRPLGADYPQGRYGQVGVAETHLGVDAAVFRGSAFVLQTGPTLDGTAGPLAEALGRVVASAGRESCASALERLEEGLRGIGIGPTAKNTPHARMRAQVEALEREWRRGAEARARQVAALERRRELRTELAEQQQHWATLQAEHNRRRLVALRDQISTLRRLDAERQRLLAVEAPATFPSGAAELLDAWRLHQSRCTELMGLRSAAEQVAVAVAAQEERVSDFQAALAALPALPTGALERAGALRLLAGEVAAARAAGEAVRGAAEASGEVTGAATATARGENAGATTPSPAAGPAERDGRWWLVVLAGGLALGALLLALRLPAPAAGGLAALVAGLLALTLRDSVAQRATWPGGGSDSPELAALRERLHATSAGAERRLRNLEAILDAQLAAVGLPGGAPGMTALEAALVQESWRAGLRAQLGQARAELDQVCAPQRAYTDALEALRDADTRLHAALDPIGILPGALDQRIAALEDRRVAEDSYQARRRRLDDLAEQRRLCAQGRSPAELEAEADRLRRMGLPDTPRNASTTTLGDADLAAAVAAVGDSELAATMAERRQALDAARAEHARLEGVVTTALGDLRGQAEIEEDRLRARAAMTQLERSHRALEMAREQLLLAQEEVHGDVGPRLAALVGPSFQQLTSGRYERLYVDANGLRVRVQAHGRPEPVPIEQLSMGAGDQALLLLRLAVTDLLVQSGEAMPVFLDEPLAHCDPRRGVLLLAALAQAAQQRQVFLFTCQPWVEALAMQQGLPPAVHRLGD